MTEQDIVERLRDAYADSSQRILGSRIFVEAATEIERLRTRAEKAEAALAHARNAALEEAAQIIEQNEPVYSPGHRTLRPRLEGNISGIEFANAIRALKEKQA